MACSVDITVTNLVFLAVIVLAVKKAIKLFKKWKVEKMLEKFEHTPKDKVILHSIWRCKTLPSISPFALKLETYLRMAKIPYELETKNMMGPKGKLPWITYNGTHVADSQLCIQHLNKKLSVDLNKNATKEQAAAAKACRVMLEEHCFLGLAHYRILENVDNIDRIVTFPKVFKFIISFRRGAVKKRFEDQGIGKHTPTEIYQMTGDDLRTVSTILGKDKFLGGDQPCEEDCAVFGMVAQAVWASPGSIFEKLVHEECPNLREYCERMKELYWPDWEDCLEK